MAAPTAGKMQRNSERLEETRGCCVALSEALAELQLVELETFLDAKISRPIQHPPPHAPPPPTTAIISLLSLSFFLPSLFLSLLSSIHSSYISSLSEPSSSVENTDVLYQV